MSDHTERIRRLLEDIASGNALTQRALAQRLGMALGLTNQLLRLLADRGLVMARPTSRHRVTYVLTQAGSEEHARLTRAHLNRTLESYSAAREGIRQRLAEIVDQQPRVVPEPHRVVFYGSGQAAEIGMACAQEIGLRLVGVVDDDWESARTLFGVPVWSPVDLRATALGGQPFDWILVTEFSKNEEISRLLNALGLAPERGGWL